MLRVNIACLTVNLLFLGFGFVGVIEFKPHWWASPLYFSLHGFLAGIWARALLGELFARSGGRHVRRRRVRVRGVRGTTLMGAPRFAGDLTTTQCPYCFASPEVPFSGECPACGKDTAHLIGVIRYGGRCKSEEDREALTRLLDVFDVGEDFHKRNVN